MKKLLHALLLFIPLVCISSFSLNAALPTQSEVMAPPNLPTNVLMRLLHIVAHEFHLNMNHTKALYDSGEIEITPQPQNGTTAYMLEYEGWCILAVLEDKL